MDCKYILVDIEGNEIFSLDNYNESESFVADEIQKLTEAQLNELDNKLDSLIKDKKHTNGRYRIVDLEGLFNLLRTKGVSPTSNIALSSILQNTKDVPEKLRNNISELVDYLENQGKKVIIMQVNAEKMHIGEFANDGTIIETDNEFVVFVRNDYNNMKDFAKNLNHELSHHVFDDIIKNNVNDYQTQVKEALKQFYKRAPKSTPYLKNIVEKLKKYENAGNYHEIAIWLVSDPIIHDVMLTNQDDYDGAYGAIFDLVYELDMYGNITFVNPNGEKKSKLDMWKVRIEQQLPDLKSEIDDVYEMLEGTLKTNPSMITDSFLKNISTQMHSLTHRSLMNYLTMLLNPQNKDIDFAESQQPYIEPKVTLGIPTQYEADGQGTLQFSISENVLNKGYSIYNEFPDLIYDEKKHTSYPAWIANTHKILNGFYQNAIDNGNVNLQWESSVEVQGNDLTQIYSLPAGSIVQLPHMLNKPFNDWISILGEDGAQELIRNYALLKTGKYEGSDNDNENPWATISMRRMYEYIQKLKEKGVNLSKELEDIEEDITTQTNKYEKPKWQQLKNHVLLNIRNKYKTSKTAKDGVPCVGITQEKTSNAEREKAKNNENYEPEHYYELNYFDARDVVSTRKLMGKALEMQTLPENYLDDLKKYQSELGTLSEKRKGDDDFQWMPDDHEFVNNVNFKGKSEKGKDYNFSTVYTKDGHIRVTGRMGTLESFAKLITPGTFIKFSLGKNKGKTHDMRYGKVVGSGASGLVVAYEDDNVIKTKTIGFFTLTDILIPHAQGTDVELVNMQRDKLQNLSKDEFKGFLAALYKTDKKKRTIENLSSTINYLDKNNKDEDGELTPMTRDKKAEIMQTLVKRARMGSIVRYQEYDKNEVLKSKIGIFIIADESFAYILDQYNNTIKIPYDNFAGEYDKGSKKIENADFVKVKKDARALETIFIDQTSASELVDHLDEMKTKIKLTSNFQNKIEAKKYEPTDQGVKEYMKDYPEVTLEQAQEIVQELDANKKTALNYGDFLDIISFMDYKTTTENGKKIMVPDTFSAISENERYRAFSKLRVGDKLLYSNYYTHKDGTVRVFESWRIVVEIDENSGLPITAHRTKSGRLKFQKIPMNKVKAIGKQLGRVELPSGGSIEGRPGTLEARKKRIKQHASQKGYLFTKDQVIKLLNITEEQFDNELIDEPSNYIDRTKFHINAANYSEGRFTLSNKNTEPVPEDVEQMYSIHKQYIDSATNERKIFSSAEQEYQLADGNYELFYADKYPFATYAKGLRHGSLLYFTRTNPKTGEVKGYHMFVEGATSNEIKGIVIYPKEGTEDGFDYFPMSIYKSSSYPVKIKRAWNVNWDAFGKENQILPDGEGINTYDPRPPESRKAIIEDNTVPFSEEIEQLKKSRDTAMEISDAVERISTLYNADIRILTDDSMQELGGELELDLTHARGLVHNSVIYVNGEKASRAEAFHEMGHMIISGLKTEKSDVWEVIKDKIKLHPIYEVIVDKYKNKLNEEDLAEETFVTVFGEYFREKLLDEQSGLWLEENPEFKEFVSSTGDVINNIFDIETTATLPELMNMSLWDIVNQFSESFDNGGLNVYFTQGIINDTNKLMKKIYKQVYDNDVTEYC